MGICGSLCSRQSDSMSEPTPFRSLFSEKVKVFSPQDEDYSQHVYQYSYTSHKDDAMKPAYIVHPTNVDDIVLVVNYAREHGIGIAVRTGGHQYSGASSTAGSNILLDLSDTFESLQNDFFYDEKNKLLRVGVSFSLIQLNTKLREMKMFVPHGQCVHVHLGGHFQTGGYGNNSRAFGLLCDHVEGFEIVLASGKHARIWRPKNDECDYTAEMTESKEDNDDLYWAVLGGSPGNYGISTHVIIRPLHDEDYPNSHGMRLISKFDEETMEEVMHILCAMSDDKDLPADFDCLVTTMTDFSRIWHSRGLFPIPIHERSEYLTVDERMPRDFPKEFGDGVPWSEKGKHRYDIVPVPVIVIFLQWANLKGVAEEFGEKQKYWFNKFVEAAAPTRKKIDETIKSIPLIGDGLSNVIDGIKDAFIKLCPAGLEYMFLDYSEHVPMSELARYWIYEDVREYLKPYEKRAYMTDNTNLSKDQVYAKWAASRIAYIIESSKDLKIMAQFQPFGGDKSNYRLQGHDTCHSWRKETTMLQAFDCFYNPRDPETLKTVLDFQNENDHEASEEAKYFCKKDRRALWGSYVRDSDVNGDCLDAVWDKYYDSKEKYDRLVAIKRRVDPDYVFTANMFGIDATNAPQEGKKIRIKGRTRGDGEFSTDVNPGSVKHVWKF